MFFGVPFVEAFEPWPEIVFLAGPGPDRPLVGRLRQDAGETGGGSSGGLGFPRCSMELPLRSKNRPPFCRIQVLDLVT